MLRSISVLVPVLNEEILLPEFMIKTTTDLDEAGLDWEVIMIDDGCTDSSNRLMTEYAAKEPRFKVLTLPHNMGPGANLHQAYRMATKELACYATVDGFFDTKELPGLLAWFDEWDAVSAYRTTLTAHTPRRRVQTMLNVGLQKVMFPNYKFKAYHTLQIHRTDFVQGIELEATTPFLCSELLFKATELGLRIKEVGIPYLPRKAGKATGGAPKLIQRHMAEMYKFWFKWFVLRRPMIPAGFKLTPYAQMKSQPTTPSFRTPSEQLVGSNGR